MFKFKELAKQNYQLPYEYIGEVIDNKDSLGRGRLKCKINGITEGTSTSDLPWCEVKSDLFGSSSSTVGLSSAPKIGSLVYVKFLYGNPSHPVVDGAVRGAADSSNLHKVSNLGETIMGVRNGNLTGPELSPLNTSSVYPYNNVIETDTAVIEIDDTSNNKRISIQHKNGSYIEIRPDGTVQIKSNGNMVKVVDGTLLDFITGDYQVDVGGNFTMNVGGTYDTTSNGNMSFNAPRIDHN